jgi:diguanylate cyclase (GGDEF)-like protein
MAARRDALTGLALLWRPTVAGPPAEVLHGPDGQPYLPLGDLPPTSFAPEDAAPWLAQPALGTAFLLIELRDFALFNDAHGHAAGDRHLAELGRRLIQLCGERPAYRSGGDEFLVVLSPLDDAELRAFADEVRAALEQPTVAETVRISMAATRSRPGDDPFDLWVRANRAIYRTPRSELSVAD